MAKHLNPDDVMMASEELSRRGVHDYDSHDLEYVSEYL